MVKNKARKVFMAHGVWYAVVVFLTLEEFPRDDDDDLSTIELFRITPPLEGGVQTTTSTSRPTTSENEKNSEQEEEGEEDGGRQVVGRVRVRRDALDHLGTQHVDELWRAAEDLLERSAVDDAKRRLARRRRDVDYWQRLTTLLEELDQLDKTTVRPTVTSFTVLNVNISCSFKRF